MTANSGDVSRNESAIYGVLSIAEDLQALIDDLTVLAAKNELSKVTKTQMEVISKHAAKLASNAADFERNEADGNR